MPSTELTAEQFEDGKITVVKLLTVAKLAASNKEAKTLIKQGGVQVNGEKVDDFSAAYVADQFAGDGLVLKKREKSVSALSFEIRQAHKTRRAALCMQCGSSREGDWPLILGKGLSFRCVFWYNKA